MNKKNIFCFFVIMLLMVGTNTLSFCGANELTKDIESKKTKVYVNNEYTPHDPIFITGDEDFTSENGVVGGSGTKNDPYIIEGWDINLKNNLVMYGIILIKTQAYVIIRNCKIHHGKLVSGPITMNYGIYLYGAKNVLVDNCVCKENYIGMSIAPYSDVQEQKVYYSDNIKIKNSKFSYNGFDYKGPLDLWTNLIEGRGLIIALYGDDYKVEVENCVFHNNAGFGIDISNKGSVIIKNCDITSSFVGIHHQFTSGIIIEKSNIYKNTMTGIISELSTEGEYVYKYNNIYGNLGITNHPLNPNTEITGLAVSGNANIAASYNWWGNQSGPYHKVENPDGKGDGISWMFGNTIIFEPWLKDREQSAGLTSNFPPNAPLKPSGKDVGKPDGSYTFTTSCVDPNNDALYYKWEFGDGTETHWLGPYNSGDKVNVSYSWERKGKYSIRVKAKDESGLESDWSDSKEVSMSKSKSLPKLTSFDTLQRFSDNHPIIFSIFNKVKQKFQFLNK